ncbi:fasciclin-like arabinogalactan protein 14 [Elaeis guineensis]|uniref:Fasciclin-like arabinogalactan protein 3 n=1 Tax=Elaeis guineensis var. tenera TaxID=51953 RepID=A0A6I9QWD3_ELAGV|nr:fasciclin-like arabinogalactan protein 3 [Elaeis guineensis]
MAPKPQAIFLLLSLLLSSVMAYNVTQILEPFSDFATFNNYLTRTKLADEINRRQTITVLVVDNSKMSALSSLDVETLKHVMAVHVILDYYDENKLSHISNNSALLTTLFQTTGIAKNNLGFLNVTRKPNEAMLFGSAFQKAPLSSTFSKVIITMPYNISILQISDPIVPPGIGGAKKTSSSMAPKNAPALAPVAKPAKSTANAPAPIEKSMTDAPVEAPNAVDSPAAALKANASKPTSDAPVASPTPPRKVANMSASSSSASRLVVDSIVGLVIGVVLLVAF